MAVFVGEEREVEVVLRGQLAVRLGGVERDTINGYADLLVVAIRSWKVLVSLVQPEYRHQDVLWEIMRTRVSRI